MTDTKLQTQVRAITTQLLCGGMDVVPFGFVVITDIMVRERGISVDELLRQGATRDVYWRRWYIADDSQIAMELAEHARHTA